MALLFVAMYATRGQQTPPVRQVSTSVPYTVQLEKPIERVGFTRNIEVELYRDNAGLHRMITALEGNQFALRKPGPGEGAAPPWERRPGPPEIVGRMLAPILLPGDSGIRVKVDPQVGFTEIGSLKILDPVTLNLRPDGIIEADREGVRAVLHKGSVRHSPCFVITPQTKPGYFNIGEMLQPKLAEDGSWIRPSGARMDCPVSLDGKDGEHYISRKVTVGDKAVIAFVVVQEGR